MKILIAGDFCPRDRVAELFERQDYASVLEETRSLINGVDYSIVNFECPVVEKNGTPIKKAGPNLCCSSRGIEAIKYAGFDCVTLANNHFRDFGDDGCCNTLSVLNKNKIDYVGGGRCIEEAQETKYVNLQGQTLAIINACEHEYSIASDTNAGSNPLNPIQQFYAIQEARKKAAFVLVIIHGGHEYYQLPSPRMVELYRFFVDAGADVVLNHHQHCFSGYEIYNGKPIFYGLGNFCFDMPSRNIGTWTEGYAVTIDYSKEKIAFDIHPYIQCAEIPTIHFLENSFYNQRIDKLNEIIESKVALKKSVERYYEKSIPVVEATFEPIHNRIYLWLKTHGILPSLIRKNNKEKIRNYVCCEAHKDRLVYWLNKI